MTLRILHAHSTFSLGGKEARAVRLMNAFGPAASHTILSATDQFGARDAIGANIAATFPRDAPPLVGKPEPLRYLRLARYMRRFDLVLTYNWGAMDVVAARRLFAPLVKLPPLIHHEDGFNEDEAQRRKPVRNRFRRLCLPTVHRLVIPSRRLKDIAKAEWGRPDAGIERIPNGIPLAAFQQPPSVPIPGLHRGEGMLVVGTVAGLRAVKNLPRLVRAFAASAPANAQLVIVGDGPDRGRILAEAQAQGVADRLVMPGFMRDPAGWIGHFDLFALSSDSEQFPICVIEAMAAGLPVAATDVGDVYDMLSPLNVEATAGETTFRRRLARFVQDPALRLRAGDANRRRALATFDEQAMIARYARLYGEAICRSEAFEPQAQ